MYKKDKLDKLEEYFKKYSERENNSIYFYRIEKYNNILDEFLYRYLKESQKYSSYFDEAILVPMKNQIDYFLDIMGNKFELKEDFINRELRKWIPNLSLDIYKIISTSLFEFLFIMNQKGKNENILKNIYIKFMCWFHYRFKGILTRSEEDLVPKILYIGSINLHELEILNIMSKIGCDVLILTSKGQAEYNKIDINLDMSYLYNMENGDDFPEGFSVKSIVDNYEKRERVNFIQEETPRLSYDLGESFVKTNNWIVGDIFEATINSQVERGPNKNYFYNVFGKFEGVENKDEYLNELLHWKVRIETVGRKFIVFEEDIDLPTGTEVSKIVQNNWVSKNHIIKGIVDNFKFEYNEKIEKTIKKAFVDILDEDELDTTQKVKNAGVVLLCWFNRYFDMLFNVEDLNKSSVVVFFGLKGNKNENRFIKFISKLPIDVFIINPNLSVKNSFQDENLYSKTFENSLDLKTFPLEGENIQVTTTAYEAERELDTLLYQGTGMYRRKQFKKAIPITLKTTFEEIGILWKEESKVRSGFEILEDRVIVPTIFAKVSGVPDGNEANYWRMVSNLVTKDTFLIKKVPFIDRKEKNPIVDVAHNFIKDRKLDIEKIKSHNLYKYGHLQENVQDFILYGLQKVLDSEVIKETFTNGVEYTTISTILNMDSKITRLIQNYDFTKDIPKLMLFSLREEICSLEDSILVYFLNSIGFDIIIFTPTGYQCVEKYYNKEVFLEHQVGEYLYNMIIPNIISKNEERKKGGILSWLKL